MTHEYFANARHTIHTALDSGGEEGGARGYLSCMEHPSTITPLVKGTIVSFLEIERLGVGMPY